MQLASEAFYITLEKAQKVCYIFFQEQDLKGKIVQLEQELQKQRDRCLAMIDEKEDEVASLKSR
jgi:hypothetical protein